MSHLHGESQQTCCYSLRSSLLLDLHLSLAAFQSTVFNLSYLQEWAGNSNVTTYILPQLATRKIIKRNTTSPQNKKENKNKKQYEQWASQFNIKDRHESISWSSTCRLWNISQLLCNIIPSSCKTPSKLRTIWFKFII